MAAISTPLAIVITGAATSTLVQGEAAILILGLAMD
jgi:hypothetical protein